MEMRIQLIIWTFSLRESCSSWPAYQWMKKVYIYILSLKYKGFFNSLNFTVSCYTSLSQQQLINTRSYFLSKLLISNFLSSVILVDRKYYWQCWYRGKYIVDRGFPSGPVVKNQPTNARDMDSIPGLGRSPGKEMATQSRILAWRIHG